MLDSDLAELYGVETKVLKQAVKRNMNRFPEDFAFVPDNKELNDSRSQFVTSNEPTYWNHNWVSPLLFTEYGVAMLSSVLRSEQAIEVNISIIRTFTKLRKALVLEKEIMKQINELKSGTNKVFKIVFERMENLEDVVYPKLDTKRKKIGLKKD